MQTLKDKIRHVPDFPTAGILFYDITTLLRDSDGFKAVVDSVTIPFTGSRIDVVVGIESRGFILGGAVADRLGALEYGTDCLEIHEDAVSAGQRVLIVDDVIATGGTAKATAALVRRLGGDVEGLVFLIELLALNGRAQLVGEHVVSILKY
jgi:adenine phosphoribosyltransferase